MTTQATTPKSEARSKRRGVVLLSLALGAALSATVALAGTAREAEATFPGTNGRIVFDSERTTGVGVDNPEGDQEIFTIKPDGTGLKQLTFNTVNDYNPVFSPDGTKIAYSSDLGGDPEIYLMNALDGSGNENLTNNGVEDYVPTFSPDGTKIAYESRGIQPSNLEGDFEVYRMSASDGSGQKNLTNNGSDVIDRDPVFSPSGTKIAYWSSGIQPSNLEGDIEVYVVSASDGLGQKNLTNNGSGVNDRDPVFSPSGTKIAYKSQGIQISNPQGEEEIYVMNALDGSGNENLTNNGASITEDAATFSPDGTKIAYESRGIQTSNPQGDYEVYRMSALDGTAKKNLTRNGGAVHDYLPTFSPDSKRVAYESRGVQSSNAEGDDEIYRMSALDGSSKKNLTNNAEFDYEPDWGRQAM